MATELMEADALRKGMTLRTAGVKKDGLPDRGVIGSIEDSADGEKLLLTVTRQGRTYAQAAAPGDLYYVER